MSFQQMFETAKARNKNHIGELCKKCLDITSPKDHFLEPMCVHVISIPIVGFNTLARLLRIQNHCCEKPWRVLTQYVVVSKNTPFILLHIVSPVQVNISANEPLCHGVLTYPEEAFYEMKGNIYLKFQNLIYTCNHTY